MIRFIDKKTNEIKQAYSFRIEGKRAIVKFFPQGKEYFYLVENVELIDEPSFSMENIPFKIYQYQRICYHCNQRTTIFTYIIYSDTEESLTFPWDKEGLLQRQNILMHLADPSIEYYGLRVLGSYEKFDDIMLKCFPNKISVQYSKTTNSSYAMNICEHCGAKQGNHFVYANINYFIKEMIALPEVNFNQPNF